VSIREGLHGVNSNPEVAPIINGDYDGDSVSLISIHDKDVLEVVKKRAAVALEVIDPRHVDSEGRHKVMVGHGPDLKRTMFHNPEYKEAYETICSRMQDVYDAHCKGVDENGNMRGPDSRYDETYLADMQPWMSRMNRLIKYGQSLGCCKKEGVLDLSNPGSIVESLVDVCIVPGAKGSYNSLSKLCEYAGFRSDGHEGINMEDAWEKLCTSSVMPAIGFSDLRQDGSLVLGVDGDITRNAVMNALDSEPVNWRESREGFETWFSEQVGKTHSDAQEAASVMSDVMAAYDDVVERGVDMVIDYDSIIAEDHTLHSYADDISVQDATALKTVATGEMGIGNTTTSTAMTCAFVGADPMKLTGPGTGLSSEGVRHKAEVIRRALDVNMPDPSDPLDVLSKLGGFDIAAMCGLFLGGAVHRVPVVIDGFISAVAAYCAWRLRPECKGAMLSSHLSAEPGAAVLLERMGLSPVIHANMHLGEGTGAACLVPLLDMALNLYTTGPTLSDCGITTYKVDQS
jgi:hypothetical protein